MNTEKVKMSQDELYKYLNEHGVIMSRIAELMGVNSSFVFSSFRHLNNYHGNPRCFSVENIKKLNDALRKFAIQLHLCVMTFGTEKTYTNRLGRTYDPGMIEHLNCLGDLLNLTALVERVLGWNKGKRVSVLTDTMSKAYGNISKSDITKINAEILAVAGVLENVEVVPDENAFKGYGSDRSSSSTI